VLQLWGLSTQASSLQEPEEVRNLLRITLLEGM
jgi:hypothetical protein